MNAYPIDHQRNDGATILGRSNSPAACQAKLSERATRLIGEGARGELLLVNEATGEEVARQSLHSDPDPDVRLLQPPSTQ
jgi:hypothetical protein